MNQELLSKVSKTDFAKLFRQKGYAYFTAGYYNLNIIGIRAAGNVGRGQTVAENMKRGQPHVSRPVTNQFDDIFVVEYNTPARLKVREVFAGTTEPGRYYMRHPSNAKGTAILVPGQWRGMWRVDWHRGKYKALCQRTVPVRVFRDANRNEVYDLLPDKQDYGIFGINMHRSVSVGEAVAVDKYSAGCQVFQRASDFARMMYLAQQQISEGHGNSFTYTLLDECELGL